MLTDPLHQPEAVPKLRTIEVLLLGLRFFSYTLSFMLLTSGISSDMYIGMKPFVETNISLFEDL